MPNYHSGRVKDPDKFLKGKKYWATITLKNTDGIQLVTGKLEKDGPGGPMTAQAYRFPKDKYTETEAKDWLKKRKIKTILFEPAESTKEEAMITTTANIVPSFDDYWDRVNKKKKKPGIVNEQEVIASGPGGPYDGFAGGYHWRERLIRDALRESKKYGEWQEIFEVFDDRVYIGAYDSMTSNQRYFEIEYEIDEEEEIVSLGDATEIEKKTEWIIKEQAERTMKGLFPLTEMQLDEAKWTKAFINTLPDSSFAYVEAGGEKDGEGKTVPRGLRHLPYKDENGKVDLPHLRNALARLSQTNLSAEEMKKAQKKLDAAAKKENVGQE